MDPAHIKNYWQWFDTKQFNIIIAVDKE